MKNAIHDFLKSEKAVNPKSLAYWGHFRIKFHYSYLKYLGLLEETSFSTSKLTLKCKISYLCNSLLKLNLISLFSCRKDNLIFSHPRAPKGCDLNTKELQEKLKGTAYVASHSEKFSFQGNTVDSYTDVVRFVAKLSAYVLRPFFFYRAKGVTKVFDLLELSDSEKNKMSKLYVINTIEFDILYRFYRLWFSTSKFKRIYVVTSYYNVPLVLAAKKLGIDTVEIQHGVISKYHVGYNCFIDNCSIFFPDSVYFWGGFWIENCNLPEEVNKKIYGTGIFDAVSVKLEKKKNTIVFISQTSISSLLSNFILNSAPHLSEFTVYVKLHPGEFYRKDFYNTMYHCFPNIQVVSCEYTLEELLQFCEYQVGAYSTGIYQGISYECKTVLIKSPGIYYMECLYDQPYVKVTDGMLDSNTLQDLEKPTCSAGYFFSQIERN